MTTDNLNPADRLYEAGRQFDLCLSKYYLAGFSDELTDAFKEFKQALTAYDKEQANDGNQMEGETIEWVSEILMGSESLPASIEILRQFVDQNTAPLLSQIAEKDKRIAELEAENENLKSDADRFRKLQSDIEKISKSPLPDLGFRKPSWEDLNKPMDI